ncbi:MAG: hypothetical protein JXR37_12935 [Kiritimatiellae bacterium]|nr:hypothetical protein [Kiritimatiellia bacterium]
MTSRKPKIGLLPLYLELYDRSSPKMRERVERFRETITAELEKRGLAIVAAPVCRLQAEFADAVNGFEQAGADAIVTLHMAYSPSLESADVLAGTRLPIIVLDTTPVFEFGPDQSPAEISYNHGIHGVQDMCNLLIRKGKRFQIEAGHWQQSDVLDRVAGWGRAARMAAAMRGARVGRIGEAFRGMGDFSVPSDVLKQTIGAETVAVTPADLAPLVPDADAGEVAREMAANLADFAGEGIDEAVNRRTARSCLAVRRWLEQERLTAFSMNFLAFDSAAGIPTVPFLEASKAMARGIGYAGEGDVLTAALVGALMTALPESTFTEIFCPDWAGDSLFLSHMGEMNIALSAGKPALIEKPFPYTDVENPAAAVGRFRGGDVVLVNLAPGPQNNYSLLVASGEMLPVEGEDKFANSVHGWFKPNKPITDFLADYSRAGGTHHSALAYGDVAETVVKFGKLMGWETVVI